MPTIQGRTRKELRQSIGYNLGAMRLGSATDTGSTTTIIDASLTTVIGGNDDHIGKWIVFTSDGNDGDIARVTDYVASSTTLTFAADAGVAIGTTTASGHTYELWDMDYSPSMIHDMINQAVINATGHVYDPVESVAGGEGSTTLHSDGKQLQFDIPSGFSMVQDIYYRDKADSTTLHSCTDTFDTNTVTYFSVAAETEIDKRGSALKFTLNDGGDLAAGTFLYDTITSKDISQYDYIEFWIKCSTATSAGNLKIHLDNGAITADGNDLESISVPALTADTWTFIRAKLTNPELNTAIISVGLEQDSDLNSSTKYFVWLDEIRVVRNDSAQWQKVPRNLWKIDREASQIVFDSYFKNFGYKLLKLVGGEKPALLSTDSTATEIDDNYIIATATAFMFSATSGGPSVDPDARRQQAAFWMGLSEQSKRSFPMLRNIRTV